VKLLKDASTVVAVGHQVCTKRPFLGPTICFDRQPFACHIYDIKPEAYHQADLFTTLIDACFQSARCLSELAHQVQDGNSSAETKLVAVRRE